MTYSDIVSESINIQTSYNQFVSSSTIYSYLGTISQKGLDSILSTVESTLSRETIPNLAKKKIFNILVEGLQNIFFYHKKVKALVSLKEAFVLVNQNSGHCNIAIGNYMFKEDVEGVKSRIETVNKLDRDELRDLYRGVLDVGGKSEVGGAGLGFIDMAKRSSSQLISNFYPVDNKFVLFTLELKVNY